LHKKAKITQGRTKEGNTTISIFIFQIDDGEEESKVIMS